MLESETKNKGSPSAEISHSSSTNFSAKCGPNSVSKYVSMMEK